MKLTATPSWRALTADAARLREDRFLPDRGWWLVERPFWAVAVYRLGKAIAEAYPGPLGRGARSIMYLLVWPLTQVMTNVEIPFAATIGPGLRIYHGSGVVIHPEAVVGANLTIRQGCTIGIVVGKGSAPTLGDNVEMGSNSQILGAVIVGDSVKVGSQALVLHDVPPGASVGGVPARVLTPRTA